MRRAVRWPGHAVGRGAPTLLHCAGIVRALCRPSRSPPGGRAPLQAPLATPVALGLPRAARCASCDVHPGQCESREWGGAAGLMAGAACASTCRAWGPSI